VRLWFPRSGTAIDVTFSSGAERRIVGSIFDGTERRQVKTLASYNLDQPYAVSIHWNAGTSGAITVRSPDGTSNRYAVDRSSGLALFNDHFVNLSLDSAATGGRQDVGLANFQLAIPSQTTFATRASDPRLVVITALIALWSLSFAVYWVLTSLRPGGRIIPRLKRSRAITVGLATSIALLAIYAVIATIDAHPYDRLAQEGYAYVSQAYGLGSLYDRTSVIPDSAVRGGHAAWSSPPFAYPPVLGYAYWLIGHAWHFLGGTITPLHDRPFEVFWKLSLAVFVPINAALIYLLLRKQGAKRWAIVGVASYALNPAIAFDAVVWGETEAIVTTALLGATLGFVTGRPRLGWPSFVIAALLKQTALFALPIVAIYSVKKFGWRRTVESGALGVVVGFCAFAPFAAAGYAPVTIYKSILGQVMNFANPTPTYASSDTFSVWTIADHFTGLSGFDRIWAPHPLQIGGVAYSSIGTVLFAAAMLLAILILLRTRPLDLSDSILFLAISFVLVTYVFVSTLASARYLLLALPLMIVGLGYARPLTRLLMIGGISLISLLSMYGVLMQIAVRGDWPVYFGLGNPSTNALSHAIYALYTSDAVITVLALALFVIAEEQVMRLILLSTRSRATSRPNVVVGEGF
jgi:hypothetical protein